MLVPIDVVKTRKQTAPGVYGGLSLVEGGRRVVEQGGVGNLFAGLGPTVAGYAWYGLTVYPGYEFLKRLFLEVALDAQMVSATSGEVPESVKVGGCVRGWLLS